PICAAPVGGPWRDDIRPYTALPVFISRLNPGRLPGSRTVLLDHLFELLCPLSEQARGFIITLLGGAKQQVPQLTFCATNNFSCLRTRLHIRIIQRKQKSSRHLLYFRCNDHRGGSPIDEKPRYVPAWVVHPAWPIPGTSARTAPGHERC